MAKQKWTRSEAVEYLAASGFHFKPHKNYTTAYLKRTASSYKKQESKGQKPSLSVARGHAEVRHIPAREERRQPGRRYLPARPEQYSIGTKGRAATKKDVEKLLKYAQKPPKAKKGQPERHALKPRGRAGGGTIAGNVSGILARYYGTKNAGDDATLSFKVSINDFNLILEASKDLTELGNNLLAASGHDAVFELVYSVNVLS